MADKKKDKKPEEVEVIFLNEEQTGKFLKKMLGPEGEELHRRLKVEKEAQDAAAKAEKEGKGK